MVEFTIYAKEFGGLAVDICAGRDGINDARFMSSGNRLPPKMYDRLINSAPDLEQIDMEINNAIYEGEL